MRALSGEKIPDRLQFQNEQAMKCSILCFVSAGILYYSGPLLGAPPTDSAEKVIRKVLDDQVAAWNRGDLEGFMKGYWKSPDLTFSSGKDQTKGWQATLDRYRKRYQGEGREMGKLTFFEVMVKPLGRDSAYVRGRWQLVRSKDKPGGLFTLILRRLPEGWRIVHDHTSN
jgi:ketosteroid isomerase-like protein